MFEEDAHVRMARSHGDTTGVPLIAGTACTIVMLSIVNTMEEQTE